MSITVQCQGNGCSLSSKDGTVIPVSFGQLAAGCLTILEMTVDNRCCPHPLINLRSVGVDFIMWSLSIRIFSEFGLSLFFSDHEFQDGAVPVEDTTGMSPMIYLGQSLPEPTVSAIKMHLSQSQPLQLSRSKVKIVTIYQRNCCVASPVM